MPRIASILIATIIAAAQLLVFPAGAAEFTPLNIYYVRHGETIGNVTHKHTYFNDRTFSDEGIRQVKALTGKLDEIAFDHVFVSPKYRAMNTVLPYLKKHNMKAEIWPELAECCWQKERGGNASNLSRGSGIEIEPAMQPYFTFAERGDAREFKARDYASGISMVTKSFNRIVKSYSGSGKSILVVGHYHAGGRLIDLLQGYDPVGSVKLSNAKITQLQEQTDGNFRVIASNF